MKKDKHGEILTSASDNVCEKCRYKNNAPFSTECNHCDTNLEFNEFYKSDKVMKKIKIKGSSLKAVELRVFEKITQGWNMKTPIKTKWFSCFYKVELEKK